MIFLYLAGNCLVIFLFVKQAISLLKKFARMDERLQRKWSFIITCVLAIFMPIVGLMLNQWLGPLIGSVTFQTDSGMFGNFSPLFYAIAATNGLLLLIAPVENKKVRLALFYLRAAGYTYVLYFFIVLFLYLLLGVLLLLVLLGAFLFAPLALLCWQGAILWRDAQFLHGKFQKDTILIVFLTGLFTLPFAAFLKFLI